MPFRNLPFVSGSHIIIKLTCAMTSPADHQYYYCSIISAVFQELFFLSARVKHLQKYVIFDSI